jgi:hypothetical protein
MGTLSFARAATRSKRAAVASLSVLCLAGLVAGGATAAQASASTTHGATQAAGVPWSSVGQGWILADLAKSPLSGHGTLYLVSPGGQRYRIGPAPANTLLEDWSGNGTDALFFPQNPGPTSAPITVVNLHTGRATSFTVSANAAFPGLSFSRPDGTAILLQPGTTASGASLPLERFSLTGALELSYPTQFPQAGTFDGGPFLESASGSELVLGTQNGLELVSNSGQPIRALATHGPGSCGLLNWWNNENVVASCGDGQLLVYPLSGGRPQQLTSSRDIGTFLGAWHIPSGTYAEAAACGTTWLEKLNSNGTSTTLTIPGAADAGTVQPLGTMGNQLPLLIGGGCDGHYPYRFVDWYTPSTNAATTVIGGPAGGGYVTGAVLFRASGQPGTSSF